jgi:tetratricopeptide (TPR) repeat protein
MAVGRLKLIARRHAGAFARAALLISVLGAKYVTCVSGDMDCLHAMRAGDDGLAVVVCEREYAETRDAATGASLASALRRSGKTDAAEALANTLLATSARADAFTVLGRISLNKGRLDEALDRLRTARGLHYAAQQQDRVAGDDQAIAGIFWGQQRFTEALRTLDDCVVEARQGMDRRIEGYCHLSAGLVLRDVGYFEGAQAELALAEPMLTTEHDLATLDNERAGLLQRHALASNRREDNRFAIRDLEHAVEHARRAARTSDQRTTELNLVYSLAEVGETAAAAAHLERARVLDVQNNNVVVRALLEARIAYRAGNGALAMTINTANYDKVTDDDTRLDVCVIQARIAMGAGDLDLATVWATRGVELAERMRRNISAIELRPWMLSIRRQPYELLFAALARSHDLKHALAAFDQWQARTLLDSSLRDRNGHVDLRAAASDAERYYRIFPMLSNAPFMQPVEAATVLDRLRDADLVALLVADDEVWRIVSRHGALDIVVIGPLAGLQRELAQFKVTPTDRDLGESLGVKLLGADAFRETGEPLFAVLDGPLAGVPIAAMRAKGHPLVAMRPVVHAPRLSAVGCVPAREAYRHAVVIADARGDLPAAAQGATEIAARFGVAPAIGPAATSNALFSATRDDVLHLAVHASIELGIGTLLLHDRQVSALEIAGRGEAPALVILSACISAVSDDSEQATSLATAFLAAGSSQVIATLRPVTDVGAAELTRELYKSDGVIDPARTLARIQASLADKSTNSDWPNFVLFGHDTCRKEPRR